VSTGSVLLNQQRFAFAINQNMKMVMGSFHFTRNSQT